ncbi:hypothetical protein L1049_005000 [Liquidambar formosana]|uniref:Uncharacterized protein n=1 Tax=Liquidambar formosana TaxID=63359 RepID=A0AAP0RQK4_LIQFO
MGRNSGCGKEIVNRGAWSFEEDQILINYVKIHGEGRWNSVAKNAGLNRSGKSCRLRWLNYLRPGIKRGDISEGEEDLIIKLHRLLGNRWALIAGRLPGRTDNEIKNYWNTILVKKFKCHTRSHHKQPVENSAPNIPQEIAANNIGCSKVVKSPGGYHFINESVGYIHNGNTPSSSFQVDEDSLNFPMHFNANKGLTPDVVLNSDFSQIHVYGMHRNGNMVGGDDVYAPSFECPVSEEVSLPNGMRGDPIQPTLELELKKVASFLELEDVWEEL